MARHDEYLVELDCLFDTRMGVVSRYFPGWAEKLIAEDRYHNRIADRFDLLAPGFPQAEFEEQYKKRRFEDLAGHVYRTKMVSRVTQLCAEAEAFRGVHAQDQTVGITINTYPHQLSEEMLEMLMEVFEDVFPCECIRLASMLPDFLTPAFISKTFSGVILYDMNLWLTLHHEALKTCLMPQVQFMAPIISQDPAGNNNDIYSGELVERIHRDLRPALEMCLSPLDDYSFDVLTDSEEVEEETP